MSDDGGCLVILAMLFLGIVVGMGACSEGRDQGRREGACRVRVESTKTAADTLALLRRYPECTPELTAP